jgi:hypothetical protein
MSNNSVDKTTRRKKSRYSSNKIQRNNLITRTVANIAGQANNYAGMMGVADNIISKVNLQINSRAPAYYIAEEKANFSKKVKDKLRVYNDNANFSQMRAH